MSAILEKEPPPLTNYIARAPAELQQIISKTLRKDREQRYHSAHELLEALKDLRRKLEVESGYNPPLRLLYGSAGRDRPAALVLVLTNSCFGAGASILLASKPVDELTARQKHRRVAI